MINVPTVLCSDSYEDIEEGHFAQTKENKKGILQNRKKKSSDVWFEAYSGVFQAKVRTEAREQMSGKGSSCNG